MDWFKKGTHPLHPCRKFQATFQQSKCQNCFREFYLNQVN
uniref:Uncharacterized protein n=1 Tax=Sander lucioperca TaxID=283035 RepID=A0A8D0ADY2_SANLU